MTTDTSDRIDDIISDADNNLMEALGYINAIKFIIRSFDSGTRGAVVDDALYSMQLAAESAAALLTTTRNRLEDVDHLPSTEGSTC